MKEKMYNKVSAVCKTLGIRSEYYRVVLINMVIYYLENPSMTTTMLVENAKTSMPGKVEISTRKAKEKLVEVLHEADLPKEELFNGKIIMNTVKYVANKVK